MHCLRSEACFDLPCSSTCGDAPTNKKLVSHDSGCRDELGAVAFRGVRHRDWMPSLIGAPVQERELLEANQRNFSGPSTGRKSACRRVIESAFRVLYRDYTPRKH